MVFLLFRVLGSRSLQIQVIKQKERSIIEDNLVRCFEAKILLICSVQHSALN